MISFQALENIKMYFLASKICIPFPFAVQLSSV